MTAEITIMNKSAIAMAADSAVTVQTKNGPVVYQSENKLFRLSKFGPVGVMIYNNTELCGLPWETIIKTYRQKLHDATFDHIEEYADDFLGFLKGNVEIFPLQQQRESAEDIIVREFAGINAKLSGAVDANSKRKVNERVSNSNLLAEIVGDRHNELSKLGYANGFDEEDERVFRLRQKDQIKLFREYIFGRKRFPSGVAKSLDKIAGMVAVRDEKNANYTGVVVAGFGAKEFFPHLVSYEIESVVNNKLKYRFRKRVAVSEKWDQRSSIEPFAQEAIIEMILKGINPEFRMELMVGAIRLVHENSRDTINRIAELSPEQKRNYITKGGGGSYKEMARIL